MMKPSLTITVCRQLSGLTAILFFLQMTAQAQKKDSLVYTNAETLTLVGKIEPTKHFYHRVDTTLYPGMPARVKQLLTNSAGLAIAFTTNSNTIAARWCTSTAKQLKNLTAIANKGLDLYIKKNGRWQFAGVGRPSTDCGDDVLVENLAAGEKECLLYLPLYDELQQLQIGVLPNTSLKASPQPFSKRVLVYGSSIVQGASASRPGMAYPSMLARSTGLDFLNMGVSASAKMEKVVADMVAATPADAYLLDCVPNSSPEQIRERTVYLVTQIRMKNPKAPIIFMQTIVREHGYFDQKAGAVVQKQNEEITRQVEVLKKSGIRDLYFITAENLLGHDHEGTTDGIHPNDLGFFRMYEVLLPRLTEIFKAHHLITP
jgi:hypothetical protein